MAARAGGVSAEHSELRRAQRWRADEEERGGSGSHLHPRALHSVNSADNQKPTMGLLNFSVSTTQTTKQTKYLSIAALFYFGGFAVALLAAPDVIFGPPSPLAYWTEVDEAATYAAQFCATLRNSAQFCAIL